MDYAVLSLLHDLVSIKSINPPGEEAEVCLYLTCFFQDLDIKTSLHEVLPGRHNLIAGIKGKESGAWLFTGHMDVVPIIPSEGTRWRTDPFQPVIQDGRLYGRGSSDMKAGLAAAMAAMARIKQEGTVPPQDIILCATVDEEYLMRGSEHLMKEQGLENILGIVVCEPTGLTLCPASRGRSFGQIRFFGTTGHGSGKTGSLNAIDLAVAFIHGMKAVRFPSAGLAEEEETFWRALSINAGVEPGIVPDQCCLGIDARLALGTDPALIWQKARELLTKLKQTYPAMTYAIEIADEREPWSEKAVDPFVTHFGHVLEECGIPLTFDTFPGTTDGTKLRRSGAPCLICGPGDLGLVHRENESVDLSEVELAAEVYYRFMTKIY